MVDDLQARVADLDPTVAIDAIQEAIDATDRALEWVVPMAVRDPSPLVRLRALSILAQRGRPEQVHDLLPALRSEKDPHVLASVVMVLGKIGGPELGPELEPFLAHPDRRVRANAVEALEQVGGEAAVPLLRPLLSDPDNRVRANAVVALFNLGEMDHMDVLEEMLQDEEEVFAASARYALGRIGLNKIVESVGFSEMTASLGDLEDSKDRGVVRDAIFSVGLLLQKRFSG